MRDETGVLFLKCVQLFYFWIEFFNLFRVSMMSNGAIFLKMSGFISENNRKEFVQTFKLVFSQLSPDCIEKSLNTDCLVMGYYYFYSLWSSTVALKEFMKSQEFLLIEGAFRTLGSIDKKINGQLMDVQVFHT